MKKLNRVVLTNSGSWHETSDAQRIPISEFWLLAEAGVGEWQCFTNVSDLQTSVYVLYTKKQGRIMVGDDAPATFNRALLYWEEGERIGNFLYFSKGDTDYDVLRVTSYGKKVRKLIHCIIKCISPVIFIEDAWENQDVRTLIEKVGDVDESIESQAGM